MHGARARSASTIGQIVWGSISDRFGRKYCLVIMFLWLAVAFMLFRYVGEGVGIMVLVQLFAGMATNGVWTAPWSASRPA